jgi:hypothetical protein
MRCIKDIVEMITKDELPKVLTDEIIETLAAMIDEVPQSKEWHEIFEVLSPQDYEKVEEKRLQIQKRKEQDRQASMTDDEKIRETEKRKKMLENLEKDPNSFYGNMARPQTPEDYKNAYGVWPPGYDENGNKLP